MEAELKTLLADLKTFRTRIKQEKVNQIGKKALLDAAEGFGRRWFSEFAPEALKQRQIPLDVVQRYSDGFTRLLKLASPNNLKSSYLSTLNGLVVKFKVELILPVQVAPGGPAGITAFEAFLGGLSDPGESEFFTEAIACARNGWLRAAAVMGWCATIDRIHRTIEAGGIAKFNTVSAQMASQKVGRYKKFNQVQSVTSLGELREVFDTTVLWIIEGMALIDVNQHTRLRSCFEMRCQCAHPGEAPVTEFNVMSFFSDIQQIVLQNPAFAI